jgi:hypothetical protein
MTPPDSQRSLFAHGCVPHPPRADLSGASWVLSCITSVAVDMRSSCPRLARASCARKRDPAKGGASPLQVYLLRPVSRPQLRRREVGWRAVEGDGVVRSASELDSAKHAGEPAMQRRSLDLCEQETHDAEGLGDKVVAGAGLVGGDGRFRKAGRREARRPARRKRRKDPEVPPSGGGAERAKDRASAQESEHP